ncbi:hypothetical protein GCM10008013_45570 [Paenibacillus segetis]|uniref:Uncharacterized protein n=2 Tax=Paenibacillus segetis TaxID=1325360 RepID=A0ABQ1YUT8_9BACL|nr:hypothetical protein GCM10008013_45570 [Paenibacillus segetis]
MENYSEHVINKVTDTNDVGLFKGIANSLGKSVIEAVTTRHNYVIFSVFTVKNGESSSHVLGFLNSVFIEL